MVRSILVVALMASAAAAQPVTHTCTARVVLAPDDVRQEIDHWVAAEPRCMRELEVRVVPTTGGYYLAAVDPDGDLRERIVPDAQSAAVLVVSWMADDSIAPALAPLAIAPPPAVELPEPTEAPFVVRHRGEPEHHWLTVGVIGVGVRGQIDAWSHGPWAIGLAGSWRDARDRMRDGDVAKASAYVAASHDLGRFGVRAQLGFGADVTHDMMREGIEPAVDAALFVKLRLGARWGAVAGPLLDARLDGHANLTGFVGIELGL